MDLQRDLTSLTGQLTLDTCSRVLFLQEQGVRAVQAALNRMGDQLTAMRMEGRGGSQEVREAEAALREAGGEYAGILGAVEAHFSVAEEAAQGRHQEVLHMQAALQSQLQTVMRQLAAPVDNAVEASSVVETDQGERDGECDHMLKLIVIGDSSVGKSCQDSFRTINRQYLRGVNVVIVMYDITDQGTFKRLGEHLEWVSKNSDSPFLAIVGNKSDVCDATPKAREVPYIDGCSLAQERSAYFAEVSAKSGKGVELLYRMLAAGGVQEYAAGRSRAQVGGNAKRPGSKSSSSSDRTPARPSVPVDPALLNFAPFDPECPEARRVRYAGHLGGW
ncbi:small GTPase superfamily, Ras type [Kipferlia bialata]|uniref:Small GTPase superfamily, Ras type n=1 Tax=Kipferlia bialata TaxID=797122 RepID=A0A9K3CNJ8_9EUKA|nr:small GTPase superfamily, Ras type [Kipferlia bialata]|eukprot:g516.t1